MKKEFKKPNTIPHRKPLAYSQTLYKHTGHTLKIFWKSSDMANIWYGKSSSVTDGENALVFKLEAISLIAPT